MTRSPKAQSLSFQLFSECVELPSFHISSEPPKSYTVLPPAVMSEHFVNTWKTIISIRRHTSIELILKMFILTDQFKLAIHIYHVHAYPCIRYTLKSIKLNIGQGKSHFHPMPWWPTPFAANPCYELAVITSRDNLGIHVSVYVVLFLAVCTQCLVWSQADSKHSLVICSMNE